MFKIEVTILTTLLALASTQDPNVYEFSQNFSNCKWGSLEFDKCVKDGINSVRPYFKDGIPQLDLPSFDPFFAKQIIQSRGSNNLNYKLTLRNVYERGWTDSIVTKFKSNLKKRYVQYSQFFPEKFLEGEYEFGGKIMTSNMENKGVWNLTLYDYRQTTTLSKPEPSGPIKVRIEVDSIGDMKLHIGNLLRGRAVMEHMLDRMINISWRPGFVVVRPLINDIVSTAFTEIFNQAFGHLDLSQIIPNSQAL